MNEYAVFYDNFISDVRDYASGEVLGIDEDGNKPEFKENAFTKVFIDYLEDNSVAEGADICHLEAKTGKGIIKTNAWAWDEGQGLLTLCVTLFSDDYKDRNVTATDVDTILKQLTRAFDLAISEYYKGMEPSSTAFDMMKFIYDIRESINNVEFVLFTNGFLPRDFRIPKTKNGNYGYRFDCWDIKRLLKIIGSKQKYESITIDFKSDELKTRNRFIPCLDMKNDLTDHRVYLALMPGELLSELYDWYGQRLLDLNVRSFLQVKGKVNKGIRETLCKQPDKFLAFNNGITVTVEEINLDKDDLGNPYIRTVKGFQVVNGGQTMASIHRAVKIDKADISQVYVQAKITHVLHEKIDEIAPQISRYANSQNTVSDADFASNNPIHIELQRLSEKLWAPGEHTRWYYERTRGQYYVERNRKAPTPAQARKYDDEHPTSQRFTKTDMAKFENSWNQYPHLVSLGAQKNFSKYMDDLRKFRAKEWLPDETFYKELIAKAIIFKAADKAARAQQISSYKANVVTYMVSYLAFRCIGRLDLLDIWNCQFVPKCVYDAFLEWATPMHDAIEESAGSKNITEWCKKADCWEDIKDIDFELPSDLLKLLEKTQPMPTVGMNKFGKHRELTPEDKENIARTTRLDSKTWFEISTWGKSTGLLERWQREIAITLSSYAQENWVNVPSAKQATQAVKMIDIAEENKMPGLSLHNDDNDLL